MSSSGGTAITGNGLRVASYNVHGCIGRDGHRDLDRVALVIRSLDADVVGLQEVFSGGAPGEVDQLEVLTARTGMTPLFGRTLAWGYGNALLARRRLLEVRWHDLGIAGREPRGAIDVRVETPSGSLRLVNTHLGLRRSERARQIARLLDAVEVDPAPPLVLLGDFNEWTPFAPSSKRLRSRFGTQRAPATFPAWRPVLALDRIWTDPPSLAGEVWAHDTPEARRASDHLPVVARLSGSTTPGG